MSRSSCGLSECSEGSVNRAVPRAELCPPHAGPYGGCTGEQGEPGRAVGEKFYSNRRVRGSWFLQENVICVLDNCVDQQGYETY